MILESALPVMALGVILLVSGLFIKKHGGTVFLVGFVLVGYIVLSGGLTGLNEPIIPPIPGQPNEPPINNVDTADYTVSQSGTSATVKDANGNVVFTGTHTAAIQKAFDLCPNKGWVSIEEGLYIIYCSQQIKPPSTSRTYNMGLIIHNKTLKIQGAGVGQTILKVANGQHMVDGYGALMLSADGHDGMIIEDMTLDGNKANNPGAFYDGSGLIWTFGIHKNELYSNLEVCNSFDSGIYLGNAYSVASDAGTGGPNGWAYYPIVRNIHFHDNAHMAFMHDACQCLLMENILSERDCTTGRRGIYIEGNSPDYQTSVYSGGSDPAHPAILSNITLISSHLRFTWVKNIEVDQLSINNPNAEMGATIEVCESINVHIQIDDLIRESTISGQGYGVAVGYLCPGTQITLSGSIIAKVGIAMVNLGYENANPLTSDTDLTISGGTIQATQKALYSTGASNLTAEYCYLDAPALGYNFYVDDTSIMIADHCTLARVTLFYEAVGATFIEIP